MDLQRTVFALALMGTIQAGSAADGETPLELEVIKEEFGAHLELTRRPLTELGDRYREALINLQNELQRKADLDGVLAVKNELKRFDAEKSPAATNSPLGSVSRLQKIYRTGYDEKFSELEGKIKAFSAAYREKLEALKQKLTTEGKVDAAVKVRAALETLGNANAGGGIALDKGLVLHFRFAGDSNEVVRDSSETRHDGRLMGDAKITAAGNRGRVAVFDGRGDFIEVPHHQSLAMKTDGSISIWVRPKRLDNMRGLVSKYTPNNSWTFRNWRDADRRKISFGDYAHENRSKGELKDDRWTHLVVTLNSGKVAFYFDGELDSEGERPAPPVTNDNPVRIGSCYDGRYFNGSIDDVRIYSRALSAAEVAKLFDIES